MTGRVLRSMRDDSRFGSCGVEIKVAKTGTLPKGALKDHQRDALTYASGVGMYHKIADGGYGQLPFDGFILKKAEAWVVIVYMVKPKMEVWAVRVGDIGSGGFKIETAREIGQKIDI